MLLLLLSKFPSINQSTKSLSSALIKLSPSVSQTTRTPPKFKNSTVTMTMTIVYGDCAPRLHSKERAFWSHLRDSGCHQDIKDKASNMLLSALGDYALRICTLQIGYPIKMLEILENLFASNRISGLDIMYTKRFYSKDDDMSMYIHAFQSLFGQLKSMRPDTNIPKLHRALLLLASIRNNSPLESTVVALYTKDTDKLTRETITLDLVQEWQKIKRSVSNDVHKHGKHRNRHHHHYPTIIIVQFIVHLNRVMRVRSQNSVISSTKRP